jgi:hypothetical protein
MNKSKTSKKLAKKTPRLTKKAVAKKAKSSVNYVSKDGVEKGRLFAIRETFIEGRKIEHQFRLNEIAEELGCSISTIAIAMGSTANVLYYMSRKDGEGYREPRLSLLIKLLASVNKIADQRGIDKTYNLDDLLEISIAHDFA